MCPPITFFICSFTEIITSFHLHPLTVYRYLYMVRFCLRCCCFGREDRPVRNNTNKGPPKTPTAPPPSPTPDCYTAEYTPSTDNSMFKPITVVTHIINDSESKSSNTVVDTGSESGIYVVPSLEEICFSEHTTEPLALVREGSVPTVSSCTNCEGDYEVIDDFSTS